MITVGTVKDHITNLFAGIVSAAGEISPKVAFVVLPDGKAAIALTRHGYEAREKPGPQLAKRMHKLEDVGSLADWLKRHAGDKAEVVEILVDQAHVIASVDPRNVDACEVSMPLEHHPRFDRWAKLLGEEVEISQRGLLEHVRSSLEDFQEAPLAGEDEGTYNTGVSLANQLARFNATRNMECTVEVDDLGYVKFAANSDKVQVTGKLPPKFKIAVPLFLGVEKDGKEATYELEVFLHVEPQERGAPIFSLSCPSLPVVRRQARLDVVAHLRKLLDGTKFLVGLGEFATLKYIGQVSL